MLYIGADHRGFKLKEEIKNFLAEKNYQFEDMGNFAYNPNDDYTDFAKLVVKRCPRNRKKIKESLSAVPVWE